MPPYVRKGGEEGVKMRINEEKISQIPPEGHVYYRGIQQGFGLVGEKMHFHPGSVDGSKLLILFIILPVSRVMLRYCNL